MADVEQRSPWARIWFEPQETMRTIISTDPSKGFFFLCCIYGFPLALNFIQSFGLVETVPLWALLIGALLLCPFVGMVGIYISTWLLHFTGRLIGGKGNFAQVRAAVAWSNVPSIVTVALWFFLLAVFGGRILGREFAHAQLVGHEAGILFLTMLVEMVISIWGFVILLNGLVAVQGFSIWRAFLNVILPFGALVILAWLVGWALSLTH